MLPFDPKVVAQLSNMLVRIPKSLHQLESLIYSFGRRRVQQKLAKVLQKKKTSYQGHSYSQWQNQGRMFWECSGPTPLYSWAVAGRSFRRPQGRRFYLTNPFNPFSFYSFNHGHYFSSSYIKFLRASHLSRLNPFHPLNRYSLHHWFFKYKMNAFKYQTSFYNPYSFWNFNSLKHPLKNHGSRFFLFLSLYCSGAPNLGLHAHGRFFTTYACGGQIPNFAFLSQLTTETIKNIAISIRTIFNLDNKLKQIGPCEETTNNFKVYPNEQKAISNGDIKLNLRLNLSLQPEFAKKTLEIGQSQVDLEELDYEFEHGKEEKNNGCETHEHQQVAAGCYVDFSLGDHYLSIPSMTFLTDDILNEINANLSYILRRIEELRADFQGLSELGELPIKYLPKENILRVHFPNCDRDKLEMLLKEKNIKGGVIHEDESTQVDCIGGDVETIQSSNIRTMPPPLPSVVAGVTSSNITENDLLSSLYQSGSTGLRLSEYISSSGDLYDDDILSLVEDLLSGHYECQNMNLGNHHHPLADADVVRIGGVNVDVQRGPITISDSSNEDYFWLNRP